MKYVLSKHDSQTDMTSLIGIFIILLTVNVLAPASNNNLTLECEDKVPECTEVIQPCDNQELQQCPKLCGICYSTPLMNIEGTCTDHPGCVIYTFPDDCNSTILTWPREYCLATCNLCSQQVSTTVNNTADNTTTSLLTSKTSKGAPTTNSIITTELTRSASEADQASTEVQTSVLSGDTSFREDDKIITGVACVTLLIMIILTVISILVVRRGNADKSYLYAIAIKTPSSRYKPKSFLSPHDAPPIFHSANSPPFSVTAIDSGPVNSRNSFVTNQMSRAADIIKELQRKTTTQSKDIDTPVFTQVQTPAEGEISLEKWVNQDGLIYTTPDFSDFQFKRCRPPPLPSSAEYATIDVGVSLV